jgi:hypothetical protein
MPAPDVTSRLRPQMPLGDRQAGRLRLLTTPDWKTR